VTQWWDPEDATDWLERLEARTLPRLMAEGIPACILRGLTWRAQAQGAQALLRPEHEDLFR